MRSWSINLFRIFGIQVDLHATFLLLIGALSGLAFYREGLTSAIQTLIVLTLVFTCVLLHELGHCLTARKFGIQVPRIVLLPIGGMAQFESIPREPRKELLITLAGPAVNFVIAGLILLVWGLPEDPALIFRYPQAFGLPAILLVVNLAMGFFNLLPVFPMDGGRIFRALLATRFSYLRSTQAAVYVGKTLALAGIFLALFQYQAILLACLFAFIYLGGDMEWDMVRRTEKYRGLSAGDIAHDRFLRVSPDMSLRSLLDSHPAAGNDAWLVQDPNNRAIGVIDAETIRKAAREAGLHHPVARYMIPTKVLLQQDWPLEYFAGRLERGDQRLYPVYHHMDLVGVIDANQLQPTLDWAHLRRSPRPARPPHPAKPSASAGKKPSGG
ncbi:MAG: site-2 protease family protein [Opitutales bacterium]